VFRVDLETGKIVWINEDSEGEVFSTPAVDDDTVVFASDDGGVYALERDTGALRWKFMTDGMPTSAVIAGDVVVFGSDGTLYLLRRDTGEVRWSFEVSDEISSPAIIGEMIVVGGDDGTVTAFR
jgi:outer membrane protein assembly factor BamB